MLKILCIDDDPQFLKKLTQHFEDKDVRVYDYTSLPSLLPKVDACFLDIEICNDNSIIWSKQLKDIPIIFISEHEEYVFDVVKLHVFDFIRKSHFDNEIEQTINNLFQFLYNQNDFLVFQYNSINYRIPLMDILYIETYSHQCIIHTLQSEIVDIKKSFSDLHIEAPYMIKTHHSYIMNIYHCLSLHNKQAYLKNNITLPISYRRSKEVQASFTSMHTK